MKLLFCPHCQDVRKLGGLMTLCECQKSWGHYSDDGLNAIYGGGAIPIGFKNPSLVEAVHAQQDEGDREDGMGRRFDAFVMPWCARTISRSESPSI